MHKGLKSPQVTPLTPKLKAFGGQNHTDCAAAVGARVSCSRLHCRHLCLLPFPVLCKEQLMPHDQKYCLFGHRNNSGLHLGNNPLPESYHCPLSEWQGACILLYHTVALHNFFQYRMQPHSPGHGSTHLCGPCRAQGRCTHSSQVLFIKLKSLCSSQVPGCAHKQFGFSRGKSSSVSIPEGSSAFSLMLCHLLNPETLRSQLQYLWVRRRVMMNRAQGFLVLTPVLALSLHVPLNWGLLW